MATTDPITSASTATAGLGSTQATPVKSSSVSTGDFLNLLSAEMRNQDPTKPMDPTQTITQLAQFTTLQQTTQLSQNQSIVAATNMIGAQVTMPGVNGKPGVSGVVTAIDTSKVTSGGLPQVIISGSKLEYPITSIAQITTPPLPNSNATPTTTPPNMGGNTPITTTPSNGTGGG
jgi:flagellar basal-body rod modification protein FlgD